MILLPVYSYPSLTNILVKHNKNNITVLDNHEVNNVSGEVHTTFHGVNVTLNGTIINITISDVKRGDFGQYNVDLINGFATTTFHLNISAESECFYHYIYRLDERIRLVLGKAVFILNLPSYIIIEILLISTTS